MINKSITIILFILVVLISCGNGDSKTEPPQVNSGTHKVEVLEVLQTSSYTYMNVKEQDREYWLATGKTSVQKGDILYYDKGMEMKEFASKELQRTFPTLLLVPHLSEQPDMGQKTMMVPDPKAAEHKSSKKLDINIEPVKGGVTIADIYKNKDNYSGKTVTVRGKVTKFNSKILGKNWVHIQDGSGTVDDYDLTITTNDVVKVGDVVTFLGIITPNKDFGAGYSYKVLMENAALKKQ